MIDLKEIRKNKKLTQKKLAEMLGMKQQQYQRYESKINEIPLKLFLRILDVCNLKIKIVKK